MSLWPREHGAYAQLGLPLATALMCGKPGLASIVIALAAIAAFFAHEPTLVLLGRRGARAKRETPAARALVPLLVLVGIGAALAVRLPWFAWVPVAGLGAITVLLVALRREKTTFGEIAIATALVSASLPVAIASGWTTRNAFAAAFAWAVGLAAATIAVRGVIAVKKRAAKPSRNAVLVVLGPIAAGALALAGFVPVWAFVAMLPIVAIATTIAVRPPSTRALPRLGWTLVAATVATGAAIAVGVLT